MLGGMLGAGAGACWCVGAFFCEMAAAWGC